MDSKGYIAEIKESIMASLKREQKINRIPGYDSEAFINAKTKLPAWSVHRGVRRPVKPTAGHAAYALPFRISFFAEPLNKKRMDSTLYDYEERAESQLVTDYHDGLLSNKISEMRFKGSREATLYDGNIYEVEKPKLYAIAVVMNFEFHYEVML